MVLYGPSLVGTQEIAPGNYFNATQDTLFYTQDLTRPAYTDTYNEAHDVRLTWQISQHKLAFSEALQDNCLCYRRVDIENRAPEATVLSRYSPINFTTATWTFPSTNRLLFQAGAAYLYAARPKDRAPGVSNTDIPMTELSTGYLYHAVAGFGAAGYGRPVADQANGRFSAFYTTGSHAVKVGVTYFWGRNRNADQMNEPPVSYAFRKLTPDARPTPQSITQWASPSSDDSRSKIIAIYAQDQWTIGRLTLNLGARIDALRGYYPAQTRPGGPFTPPLQIAAGKDVPNWNDFSPRLGAAYDLFGNAKTALKVTIGRYLDGETTTLPAAVNPATSIVTSAARNWNDSRFGVGDPRTGNYQPDCDLKNTADNGECGALTSNGFGTTRVNTVYAPDILKGWHARPYSWQATVVLQQELRPGMSVTAGYFRTSYGNFRATWNQAATPSDYSSYCITQPTDQRSSALTGATVCGFNDISVDRFGKTDNVVTPGATYQNVVTSAANFGRQIEIFNGVDVGISARFGRGGILNGGMSLGRTVTDNCEIAIAYPNVVGGATPTSFCRVQPPWSASSQVKFSGSYPLKWDFQASATYQNIPGIAVNTSYVASNAEIRPSLGRNLASCGTAAVCNATGTLNITQASSQFEPRLNQLDLRLSRLFRLRGVNLQGMVDMYNVFNASNVLSEVTRYSTSNSYLQPTSILGARLLKFGVDMTF